MNSRQDRHKTRLKPCKVLNTGLANCEKPRASRTNQTVSSSE